MAELCSASIERFINIPDDLRALDFSVDPNGPSGIKKATNKAQTTKNEPNTKGGPGRA